MEDPIKFVHVEMKTFSDVSKWRFVMLHPTGRVGWCCSTVVVICGRRSCSFMLYLHDYVIITCSWLWYPLGATEQEPRAQWRTSTSCESYGFCPILGVSEHVGTSENLQIISFMINYDELPSPVFSKPIPKPHLHKECGIIPGSRSNKCFSVVFSLSHGHCWAQWISHMKCVKLSCVVGS